MTIDPPPWVALHARASALAPGRQAAFALACAEHLVRHTSARPGLLAAVTDAWRVLADGRGDLSVHLSELDTRRDRDEDDVACVAYALEAVRSPRYGQSVLRAVDRAVAAAFDRVPYPEGATTFRPLSDDTEDPAVQQELAWQAVALSVAEDVTDFPAACRQLRSLAG